MSCCPTSLASLLLFLDFLFAFPVLSSQTATDDKFDGNGQFSCRNMARTFIGLPIPSHIYYQEFSLGLVSAQKTPNVYTYSNIPSTVTNTTRSMGDDAP